jgi:hypothetical protein
MPHYVTLRDSNQLVTPWVLSVISNMSYYEVVHSSILGSSLPGHAFEG